MAALLKDLLLRELEKYALKSLEIEELSDKIIIRSTKDKNRFLTLFIEESGVRVETPKGLKLQNAKEIHIINPDSRGHFIRICVDGLTGELSRGGY